MPLPTRLRFVLVTPETTLLDEPVDALRFPLYDGQIGILPGRLPLVGRLGYGELQITVGGDVRRYFVDGGFVQIKGEVVTLLTNRALPAGSIDPAKARDELQKATALRPRSDVEFASKARDVERARQLLNVAKA